MKAKTVYAADDGKEFATAEECREHEQRTEFGMIIGLDDDDLREMLAGTKPELAMAVERLGRKLADLRIEAGGSMRKGRKKAA